MKHSPECALLAFLTIILCLASLTFRAAAADEPSAHSSITAAENTLLNCYRAAHDTAEAGANVTSLLDRLNEAGNMLSRAKIAHSIGDFDAATVFADSSQQILEGFAAEAGVLKTAATQARSTDFMINVLGSAIGSVAVIFGGIVVWMVLKKRLATGES